jgi:hypothetical protein
MTRTHWLAIALLGVLIVFVAVRLESRDEGDAPMTFAHPVEMTGGPDAATYETQSLSATQSTASGDSALPRSADAPARNPTAAENLGLVASPDDATAIAGSAPAQQPPGAVPAPTPAQTAGDGGIGVRDGGGMRDAGAGGVNDAGGVRDGCAGGLADAGGLRDGGTAAAEVGDVADGGAEVNDVADGGAEVNDVADGGAPAEFAPIPGTTPQEPGEAPAPGPGGNTTPPSGQIPAPGTGENMEPGTGENMEPGTGDSTTLPP